MTSLEQDARRTTRIDVYADVVCPFTHVGLTRIAAHRERVGRHDVRLHVHAWPLEVVNGEQVSRELLVEEIAELKRVVAPDLFVGFNPELFPMTSIPALMLIARGYSVSNEHGEQASLSVRRALFEEGRDVSDSEVLTQIATDLGLSRPDATDESAVMADYRSGIARGVIGSPHFFVNDEDFFCPSLDIQRVDDELEIAFDESGFAKFVTRCFGG